MYGLQVVVLILLLIVLVGGNQSGNLGGTRFPSGISVDSTSPSAGEVRGTTLTITGAQTLTGATTLSSTLGVTGATTLSSTLSVTGATTLKVLTQGGSVLATTTSTTATTFALADLLTYSVWEVTPNVADLTYTFPASSTLSTLVPTAGDSRTWTIVNATTTAGIDVIFAAGTGSALKGVTTVDEASHGTITLVRKANSDITILTNFPIAD
ncbi:MAG: hypothetical protein WC974_09035 [Thermoplasmata archaeon]